MRLGIAGPSAGVSPRTWLPLAITRRATARAAPGPAHLLRAAATLVLATLTACGQATGPAGASAGGDPARGRVLLAQYQCGACHAIPGVPGARGTIGPPLQGFGLHSYIAGELPNRPDTLRRWIADPAALVPDTAMPDVGASDADARDMAAYLGGLR